MWAATCMPAQAYSKAHFQQSKKRLNADVTAASLWQEHHLADGAAAGAISAPLASDLQTYGSITR